MCTLFQKYDEKLCLTRSCHSMLLVISLHLVSNQVTAATWLAEVYVAHHFLLLLLSQSFVIYTTTCLLPYLAMNTWAGGLAPQVSQPSFISS